MIKNTGRVDDLQKKESGGYVNALVMLYKITFNFGHAKNGIAECIVEQIYRQNQKESQCYFGALSFFVLFQNQFQNKTKVLQTMEYCRSKVMFCRLLPVDKQSILRGWE